MYEERVNMEKAKETRDTVYEALNPGAHRQEQWLLV
jgi:hypothetical protein